MYVCVGGEGCVLVRVHVHVCVSVSVCVCVCESLLITTVLPYL